MKTEIDVSNWNRKEQYYFFKDFEEPLFGICVNVDCTKAYQLAKAKGYSFSLYYLYKSSIAANRIEPFRYRIEDDKVYLYDKIHVSTTVLRPDNTFGFADLELSLDYEEFEKNAKSTLEIIKSETGLKPSKYGDGVIHYSTIPWLHFTSISHARKYSLKGSCPKISFGKVIEVNKQKLMPVSIHVHHALMDGFSVGEYVELFQQLLNK